MARYFARIIRALFVSSIGFGGGVGLLTFIAILVTTGKQDALWIALKAGLVIGLLFGVMCAVVLLLSDLTGRLFAAQGFRTEIWELEQERAIEVRGSIKDARVLSRNALLAVPNVKSVTDDDDEHTIHAAIGPSWRSPGENMYVRIEPTSDEDRWNVKCVSACLSENVAFDYGKNFENVETWMRTINRLLLDAHEPKEA